MNLGFQLRSPARSGGSRPKWAPPKHPAVNGSFQRSRRLAKHVCIPFAIVLSFFGVRADAGSALAAESAGTPRPPEALHLSSAQNPGRAGLYAEVRETDGPNLEKDQPKDPEFSQTSARRYLSTSSLSVAERTDAGIEKEDPLRLVEPPLVISLISLALIVVFLVLLWWKMRQSKSIGPRESLAQSLITSVRYARHAHGLRIVMFRSVLFSLVVSIVPALLPVISLMEMHLSVSQLGLVFATLVAGTLVGAFFGLPYLRAKTSANVITSISMAILTVVLLALAFPRQLLTVMICAFLAGAAWSLAGSELWVAARRVIPGWVRGRMNSLQIMLGQGAIALGALVWGASVTQAGLTPTFSVAAILALVVLGIGHWISIDFSAEARVDAAPLNLQRNFLESPDYNDGPIIVTIKYIIGKENRERFFGLMQGFQGALRRNGAFHCQLDESLNIPGLFRLEFQLATWADHLRQNNRMTMDDRELFREICDLHEGNLHPVVHYYVSNQKRVISNIFRLLGRSFSTTGTLRKQKPAAAKSWVAS